jgi:hypothetical protein
MDLLENINQLNEILGKFGSDYQTLDELKKSSKKSLYNRVNDYNNLIQRKIPEVKEIIYKQKPIYSQSIFKNILKIEDDIDTIKELPDFADVYTDFNYDGLNIKDKIMNEQKQTESVRMTQIDKSSNDIYIEKEIINILLTVENINLIKSQTLENLIIIINDAKSSLFTEYNEKIQSQYNDHTIHDLTAQINSETELKTKKIQQIEYIKNIIRKKDPSLSKLKGLSLSKLKVFILSYYMMGRDITIASVTTRSSIKKCLFPTLSSESEYNKYFQDIYEPQVIEIRKIYDDNKSILKILVPMTLEQLCSKINAYNLPVQLDEYMNNELFIPIDDMTKEYEKRISEYNKILLDNKRILQHNKQIQSEFNDIYIMYDVLINLKNIYQNKEQIITLNRGMVGGDPYYRNSNKLFDMTGMIQYFNTVEQLSQYIELKKKNKDNAQKLIDYKKIIKYFNDIIVNIDSQNTNVLLNLLFAQTTDPGKLMLLLNKNEKAVITILN